MEKFDWYARHAQYVKNFHQRLKNIKPDTFKLDSKITYRT